MLDIGGLGLLIGQLVGRWGNFINREAHGSVTDSFLKMGIQPASPFLTSANTIPKNAEIIPRNIASLNISPHFLSFIPILFIPPEFSL